MTIDAAAEGPIGFIGVGTMGAPMASRLIDAGHALFVYDIHREALEPLAAHGAAIAKSAREVADRAAIIFACLPSPEISIQVALGEDGIASGSAAQIYVETSTIGVKAIEFICAGLAESGVALVDAPVSGGRRGAQAGTLSMMLAGARDAAQRVEPLAAAFAQSRFHVGERPGLGQLCKVINNALSITGTTMACEAVALGIKGGLDARTLIDVLNASSGRNSATLLKFPRHILPRNFDSGATIEIGAKDIGLYLDEAERLELPSPIGTSVGQLWRLVMSEGAAEQDITSVFTFFERWAGIER